MYMFIHVYTCTFTVHIRVVLQFGISVFASVDYNVYTCTFTLGIIYYLLNHEIIILMYTFVHVIAHHSLYM